MWIKLFGVMGGASGSRNAQIRGTQTFVGVMAAVWKRPAVTAVEVGWRWVCGGAGLALIGVVLGSLGISIHLAAAGVAGGWSVAAWHAAMDGVLLPVWRGVHLWLLPYGLFWLAVATVGRMTVMRQVNAGRRWRPVVVFSLGALRLVCLLVFLATWAGTLHAVAVRTVLSGQGDGAALIEFYGVAIVVTLALYVTWSAVSWPLHLAPLLAMRNDAGVGLAVREAVGVRKDVRSQLIETNLVMSIVKIALLVLLMVFLASPLVFTAVTTQAFLTFWWGLGLLLYFVASDYFHVVRVAAYLAVLRGLGAPEQCGEAGILRRDADSLRE